MYTFHIRVLIQEMIHEFPWINLQTSDPGTQRRGSFPGMTVRLGNSIIIKCYYDFFLVVRSSFFFVYKQIRDRGITRLDKLEKAEIHYEKLVNVLFR